MSAELFAKSDCDTLLPLKAGSMRNGIRLKRFFLLNGCHPGDFLRLQHSGRAGRIDCIEVCQRSESNGIGGLT